MKMYSQLSPRERDIIDHIYRGSKLVIAAGGRAYLKWPNGKLSNVMQSAAFAVADMQANPAAFAAVLRMAAIMIEAQQRRQGNRPVPRGKRQPAPAPKPTLPPAKHPPFRPQAMALRTFDLGKLAQGLVGAK